MSFLNRMKLWQKLAALVLVLSVPLIFLGFFHFARLNSEVARANDALDGIRYTKALGAMLSEISTHRSRMREARATNTPAAREALAVSDKKLDKMAGEIDAVDAKVGQRFNVSQQWQSIRSRWVDLKTNQARLEMSDASNRHDALIELILRHVERVALRSGLSREPDISTYIAIRMAVEDVPRALIAFGDARRYINISIIEGELTPERRTRITLSEKQFEQYLARAREGVQDSTEETSQILQPVIERAEAAFTTYDAFIKAKVLNAEKFEIQTTEAYRASREPTATLSELSDVAYIASTNALEDRLSAMTVRRGETIVIISAALALAISLLVLITRSITRPMNQAISIFHSIAAGMYDNKIEAAGTDETSQVLQSLDQLQRKLRAEVAGGISQATAELRIKGALDKSTSRMFLADEGFKIIYVNTAARRFLLEARADLRRSLPHLDIDRIVGSSLDGLFNNNANQRRVVRELATYATDIHLGARTMQIATNAVFDPDGRRIGTLVELVDKSGAVQALPAIVSNG